MRVPDSLFRLADGLWQKRGIKTGRQPGTNRWSDGEWRRQTWELWRHRRNNDRRKQSKIKVRQKGKDEAVALEQCQQQRERSVSCSYDDAVRCCCDWISPRFRSYCRAIAISTSSVDENDWNTSKTAVCIHRGFSATRKRLSPDPRSWAARVGLL